ncbi:hypothetical protein ASPCAL15103 [Aspergillus calidoustus]|uniref:C2H2-type domain-containing protein n=1 Tax=Aspergillus calidoustus TaxID=454130 RepID=A0A0U5CKV6_ASPCI|nr:hypothetical protein ASPCAL15103 [Aspergillus calidoustus]
MDFNSILNQPIVSDESSSEVKAGQLSRGSSQIAATHSQLAITRSISALEAESAQQHKLSPSGRSQIEKHVISPLLETESLKLFHPLLEDVRQQIDNERISCLRDLEKMVFSLAPDVKASDAAYVRFCQHTILCLGQTVFSLNGRDLCFPSDEQYNNGYFVNLLEEVTRFKRIGDEWQKKCKDCGKVFARPCDLTRHEKSHTRPFKCPVTSCKYRTKGWATEKEAERHYNDKHSDSPRLYLCRFESCSYKSKRESNCKQHMEKTHGWVYTRLKNNGRTKRASTKQSPTPSMEHDSSLRGS